MNSTSIVSVQRERRILHKYPNGDVSYWTPTETLVIATFGRGIDAPLFRMVPAEDHFCKFVKSLNRPIMMRRVKLNLIEGFQGRGFYKLYLMIKNGQFYYKAQLQPNLGGKIFLSAPSLPHSECMALLFEQEFTHELGERRERQKRNQRN